MRRIIYHPRVTTQADLDDLLARCGWYFHPFRDRIAAIDLLIAPGLDGDGPVPAIFDQEVGPRLAALRPKIRFDDAPGIEEERLAAVDPERDVLLNWRPTPADGESPAVAEAIKRCRARGRYFEVDPFATRMEGSFYLWAGAGAFTDQAAVLEKSRARLARFAESLGPRRAAYVFGTGPSLSRFVEGHDFSDGVCFVANSMVDNPELLARLKPRAIVAGDPLFHAGCSRYAGHFRRRLVEAMESTGAWFFTPLRDHHIYEAYLPPHLRGRVVAVPFDGKKPYNVALNQDLYVSPKANILTLLLLPLAATFFDEVCVVGCDGRPLEDNGYFWAHDKKAQINSEMDNIKVVHPAFFNIDYNDYYTEHCDTVDLAVRTIEEAGKRVVGLTPSYVPALAQRYRDPAADRPGAAELISLDPDALDDFGHFLSYDRRLQDAASRLGVAFRVYGNVALDPAACVDAPTVEPVFSLHSWTVGNRPHGPRPQDVKRFSDELSRALDLRRQRGERSRCVLYMYCGSFPHMRVIDEVLAQHPNVKACVNLFWTSFIGYRDPAYVARWKPVLERVLSGGRVLVTAMTPQLADGLKAAFGVDLKVMPHPSTTFSDAAARRLADREPAEPRGRPLVLFPGGMRAEKGFLATAASAAMLKSEAGDRVRCLVRSQPSPTTMPDMLAAREQLLAAGVRLDESDMSDEEFAEFLAAGDVVVLPYKAPDFSERTSGLVVDAMLLGKPQVVVEDTWLADVVRAHDAGVVVADSPAAIVDGVLQVVADLPERRRRVAAARPAYLRDNTWDAVVGLALSAKNLTPSVVRLGPPQARRASLPTRSVILLGDGALPRGFDIGNLHDHPVIVLNGGYRHQGAAGFEIAHYICLDPNGAPRHEAAIRAMLEERGAPRGRRVLLRDATLRRWPDLRDRSEVVSFDNLCQVLPPLQTRPLATLTHAALWAAFLGFREIVFVGCRSDGKSDKPAWDAARPVLDGLRARVWDGNREGSVPHAPIWPAVGPLAA